MNKVKPVVPAGEALRKAVVWVSEHGGWNLKTLEDSARQFDLSPLEEEFLLRQFIEHKGITE